MQDRQPYGQEQTEQRTGIYFKSEVSMMKRMRIKACIAMLILICMGAFTTTALAKNPETASPNYMGLARLSVDMSISGDGVITAKTSARWNTGYAARVSLAVERSQDGTSWINMKSWLQPLTEDIISISMSGEYTASAGYYYRVRVSIRIYDSEGNLLEKVTKYSDSEFY